MTVGCGSGSNQGTLFQTAIQTMYVIDQCFHQGIFSHIPNISACIIRLCHDASSHVRWRTTHKSHCCTAAVENCCVSSSPLETLSPDILCVVWLVVWIQAWQGVMPRASWRPEDQLLLFLISWAMFHSSSTNPTTLILARSSMKPLPSPHTGTNEHTHNPWAKWNMWVKPASL